MWYRLGKSIFPSLYHQVGLKLFASNSKSNYIAMIFFIFPSGQAEKCWWQFEDLDMFRFCHRYELWMSPSMSVGSEISHQSSRIVTRINQDYDKSNVTCAVWSFIDVCGGCHRQNMSVTYFRYWWRLGPIWALTSQSCQPDLSPGPP